MILAEDVASIAPEICIEVKSTSNTIEEMLEKTALYFAAGAEEVWIGDKDGKLHFYNNQDQTEYSKRVPDFPNQIQRNR